MPDPNAMNAAFAAAVNQKATNEANTAAYQAAVDAQRAATAAAKAYGDQAAAVEKTRAATVALGRSLRDGSAVRAARDLTRLTREQQRYRREIELSARYGRAGGFVARNERALGYAEYAASRAMGATNRLYSRGMSGTVEGGRREMELNLLGREIASIFKPVSDATTDLVSGFRKLLGGIGGKGQNALLAGGLLTAGGLGVAGLARGGGLAGIGRLAVGGGAAAGAMGLRMLGGLGGAAPAASAGGGLAAAMKATGAYGASVGTAATTSRLGMAGRAAGRLALPVGVALEGYDAYSAYAARTGAGMSGSYAAAKGAAELVGGVSSVAMTNSARSKLYSGATGPDGKPVTPGDNRRRVARQGGGFQELGSGYDQIAEGFGMVADPAVPAAKATEELGKLSGLVGELNKMVAVVLAGGVPTPPSLDRPGRMG